MKIDRINELQDIARRACARALKAGADAAEAVVAEGAELSVEVRLGAPELVQEAGSKALGLRVFRDRRAANTYTSDLSPAALERFVDETVDLAQLSEPDELNELPDAAEYAKAAQLVDLDLWDEASLATTTRQALDLAIAGEKAARAYSSKITNSDGASYGRTVGARAFAALGRKGQEFAGGYRGSYQSLVVKPIADDEGGKKRNGFWWTGSRFAAGLDPAEEVGAEAARRTLAKLGASKIATGEMPVVFDPDAGRGLVGALAGVISGGAIYRRSSYLLDREGTPVASPLVTIVDDPLLPRAPGSRPFDGEGLLSRKNVLVEQGVLRTYLFDTYSARKLGRRSNGCASRGASGGPHPSTSNLVFQVGTTPEAELLAGIERGLYVTDMMGFGFNAATGDFSRGAAGFLIEHGKLGRPVAEVTVSANFDQLWKSIDAVGDKLDLRTATACPAFRVARMTVAGR